LFADKNLVIIPTFLCLSQYLSPFFSKLQVITNPFYSEIDCWKWVGGWLLWYWDFFCSLLLCTGVAYNNHPDDGPLGWRSPFWRVSFFSLSLSFEIAPSLFCGDWKWLQGFYLLAYCYLSPILVGIPFLPSLG
jgi:hypothetical protein